MVLELIGSPFHTDAGLHPVRTLLERRCGIDRLTDQDERLRLLRRRGSRPVGWIRRPVPLLAPVLGIGAEAGYEPVAAEGRKLYELIAAGGAGLSAGVSGRRCRAAGRRGCALVRPVHHRGPRRAAGARPTVGCSWSSPGGPVAGCRTAGRSRCSTWPVDRRADRRADHRAEPDLDRGRAGGGGRPLRRGALLHRTGRGRTGRDRGARGAV